jgi:hypothetical protein
MQTPLCPFCLPPWIPGRSRRRAHGCGTQEDLLFPLPEKAQMATASGKVHESPVTSGILSPKEGHCCLHLHLLFPPIFWYTELTHSQAYVKCYTKAAWRNPPPTLSLISSPSPSSKIVLKQTLALSTPWPQTGPWMSMPPLWTSQSSCVQWRS